METLDTSATPDVSRLDVSGIHFTPTGVPGASHVYYAGQWLGTVQRIGFPGMVHAYGPRTGHHNASGLRAACAFLVHGPARTQTGTAPRERTLRERVLPPAKSTHAREIPDAAPRTFEEGVKDSLDLATRIIRGEA